MRFFIILGLVFLSIASCSTDNSTEEKALYFKKITDLGDEITTLIESSTCDDETECDYIGFGSKPCGGHWSYLVYSNSIDTNLLIAKVEQFNILEKEYNEKYNIASDCLFVMPPTSLICEDNKCKALN